MARQASVLIPTVTLAAPSVTDQVITLLTTVAQNVTIGKNQIFVINATNDINIAFGAIASTSFLTATAANCYRIPANSQTTFDMGPNCDTISIVNNVSGTTSVYIKALAVN